MFISSPQTAHAQYPDEDDPNMPPYYPPCFFNDSRASAEEGASIPNKTVQPTSSQFSRYTMPAPFPRTHEEQDLWTTSTLPPLFPELDEPERTRKPRVYYPGVDPALCNCCTDYQTFRLLCAESLTATPPTIEDLMYDFLQHLEQVLRRARSPELGIELAHSFVTTIYVNPFVIRDTLNQIPHILERYHLDESTRNILVSKLREEQHEAEEDENEIITELLRELCQKLEHLAPPK
jgi:hypothetical protein